MSCRAVRISSVESAGSDLVRRAGWDDSWLTGPSGNLVDSADRGVPHEQKDLDVGEKTELMLQERGACLDSFGRDTVGGLTAFDRSGEIDSQLEDVLNAGNVGSSVLECLYSSLGEEGVPLCVVKVHQAGRCGLGDQNSRERLGIEIGVRYDVAVVPDIDARPVLTMDILTGAHRGHSPPDLGRLPELIHPAGCPVRLQEANHLRVPEQIRSG